MWLDSYLADSCQLLNKVCSLKEAAGAGYALSSNVLFRGDTANFILYVQEGSNNFPKGCQGENTTVLNILFIKMA